MSYRSDKTKMEQTALAHRKQWEFVIQVTVMVLAAAFLALGICAVALEWIGGPKETEGEGGGGPVPVITVNDADGYIYLPVNSAPTYKKYVSFSGGELDVDRSAVDLSVPGTYPVIYTVTSKEGKSAKATVHLVVTDTTYTIEQLNALLVSEVIPSLNISDGMSKEQKVRAIFRYVHGITWGGESNLSNVDRSKWEEDWIDEAYLTLQSGKADCYSYYSLSKALFEYYGIENVGIRRNDALSNESGTHFWQVVNIGSAEAPRWYYYDSTRLRGQFTAKTTNVREACLLTEEVLLSYQTTNGTYGFYAYDRSLLPAGLTIASEILPE